MPRPEEWKGSDLRARAEVCQWLHDHSGEVHDPQGLLVGRMRTELGKGRALSQLVGDMVRDGMLERELKGRRTMMLKLVDDWGLLAEKSTKAPTANGKKQQPAAASVELDGVDLSLLAETLLALVVKRAQVQPSQGAKVEKLTEQVAKLKGEVSQLRDDLILARESEAEQRRNADSMRASLAKLQASISKPKRGESVPLAEHLRPADRKLLNDLVASLPSGS